MSNRDIYKDEFGQYHEVEEKVEELVDGLGDDGLDDFEDEDDLFDSSEDEKDSYDEDEDYASERGNEYDADED